MATLHHHSTTPVSYRPRHRPSLDYSTSSTLKPSSKPPTLTTFSVSASASASTTPSTTIKTVDTNENPSSLETLENYLKESNFRQADEKTRRLLIVLAGEPAIKRGYVFFSEVQFIPKEDLKAIDNLWLKYSSGRFGYSVQKKIWVKVDKDFTKFFIKLGWMKKLDTEIEQFNYRAFPNEFIWELNSNSNSSSNNNVDVPPEGHLPLTNALRGTQLLTMIFSHPAFDQGDDEEKRNEADNNNDNNEIVMEEVIKKKSKLESLRDRLFKPNYSF